MNRIAAARENHITIATLTYQALFSSHLKPVSFHGSVSIPGQPLRRERGPDSSRR